MWGISLTHPMTALFFCGKILLHIPCSLHPPPPHLFLLNLWSFSYTSRAGFIFILTHPALALFLSGEFLFFLFFLWGVSITHPMLASLSLSLSLMWGVSLRHPMLALFLSGEFLLHNPCWLHFYLVSLSYTSRAVFIFMQGVSLTHPVLFFFLHFFHFYQWSFSYISRAGFFLYLFIWGVSLAHPALVFLF